MRNRANQDLREYAEKKKVFLWEIADKFGFTNNYFSVLMRKEFSQENKNKFLRFVDEIAE